MAENSSNRDRRDWTLIIFLLPIGILLMVLAGQFAIRLVPFWSVDGGMGSNLDPESASGKGNGLIPPISFDILTPMGWLENFLTPGPGSANDSLSFAPFVVFEPSSTPTATATATGTSTSVTPTSTPTGTSTSTGTATSTKKPPSDDDTPTPPPPPTTCTDPAANNNGGSLPCVYPVSSTPEGTYVTGTPSGYNEGTPDGSTAGISDGNYFVITLTTPIVVTNPSETNYDFVYYELPAAPGILLDRVILSISSNGTTYYVVFNWGDGIPDTNSNVGDVAGSEDDNQPIPTAELHNNTGVAVDVDNAPSNPPPGSYSYLAIQAPTSPPPPAAPNLDGNLDVNSVEVTEVAP